MQAIQHNPARDVIIPRKQTNKEHKVKFFSNQELKQFLDQFCEDLDQSSYENFLTTFL